MTNTSGIIPTEYNVLVKPMAVEQKSKGGIILSDQTLDRRQAFATRAVLIDVSPLAFSYETWPDGAEVPKVGDTIIIAKASGVEVEGEDGETYRLLKDKDVTAIVRTSIEEKVHALDADIYAANRGAM